MQRKPIVGEADDAFEREADAVADRVASDVPTSVPRSLPVERKRIDEVARPKPASSSVRPAGEAVVPPGGQPLPASARAFFEPHLGHDFADVRVHTGAEAGTAARALNARAFTLGRDIVFGAGQYAPETQVGKRLLAHELTHVVQQRRGGHRVQRDGPAAPEVQPATPEIKREFVETGIQYLQEAAEYFAHVTTLDEARLERTLDGWSAQVNGAVPIIQGDLGGNPALLQRLQQAYIHAVSTLIRVAVSALNKTSHQLYQQHRERIHEWAWPQAATDPHANELLDALPEAERQRIRVMMTLETTLIPPSEVHDLFSTEGATTTIPLPNGVAARFSSSVPAALQRGLQNIAGTLIQNGMTVNRMATIPLDLEPFGGDYAAYRFTYVEHQPEQQGGASTHEVLIERLGTIGMEGLPPSQQETAQARFDQHNFTRGRGWSDQEYALLLEAISLVPDTLLSEVTGITFRREDADASEPNTAGHYDPDDHAITLYDRAFQTVSTRTGIPGQQFAREAVRDIAHEIGHAIDLKPLREAWARYEQAQQALRDEFGAYENPPGSGNFSGFPLSQQARFDELIEQINQALPQARSASGHRWEDQGGTFERVEGGTAAGNSAFRQAAVLDGGVRLSTYSDQEWQEYFAEAFSLYITDAETLQRLRPNVYQYFVTNFPKQ